MSLIVLNTNELDIASVKIRQLYAVGEIDEAKRDSLTMAVRALPSLEKDEVYFETNDDTDDDDLTSLLHAGIFTAFEWVTDDVEYMYGMCNSPLEAIEFAENHEELHGWNYIVNLQDYHEHTMPSTDFDLVANYWGKYLFNIAIIGKD